MHVTVFSSLGKNHHPCFLVTWTEQLVTQRVQSEMYTNTFAGEWMGGSLHWPPSLLNEANTKVEARKRNTCIATFYHFRCRYSSRILKRCFYIFLFSSCDLLTTSLTVSNATVTVSCNTTTYSLHSPQLQERTCLILSIPPSSKIYQ